MAQERILSKEESEISSRFATAMSSTRYRTSLILEQFADGITRATQLVNVTKMRKRQKDVVRIRSVYANLHYHVIIDIS